MSVESDDVTKATARGAGPVPVTGNVLEVDSLRKEYVLRSLLLRRKTGAVKAVRDVSFHIAPGETLGLVGESGCGKSTVGRCVVRLDDVTSGSIRILGQDITHMKGEELRRSRRNMQIVFQDPRDSLNDFMTIEELLEEPLKVHGIGDKASRRTQVDEMLELVGLTSRVRERHSHQVSGGQRQRVGIARALMLRPKLLVLDEATSALDVSVQAQIINLLVDLQENLGLSYLFISHDLDVVQHFCDRVVVMYLGKVLEVGPAREVFEHPAQPYTVALKSSVIGLAEDLEELPADEPVVKPGVSRPSVHAPPSGCPFRTRCPRAQSICAEEMPPLESFGVDHYAACHFPHRDRVSSGT